MKNQGLTISLIVLLLSGCSSAKKASEISAAYVPASRYNNMTCGQLVNEAEALRRVTPALEAAVNTHRSQQTGVEVVTWILFWPAAFALDKGEQQSNQLAQARGELQAIQQALLFNGCNSQPATARTSTPQQSSPSADSSLESKLVSLKNLRDKNLITEDQYRVQVESILNSK